jgi:hypothetical protein
MKRFNLVAALAALTVSLGTSIPVAALQKSDPGGCSGGGFDSDTCADRGGGGSPGPGDPSLDPSGMPPGGDAAGEAAADRAEKAAERKRKEAEKRKEDERKRREAEAAQLPAKSLGRVPTSSPPTPGPQRSICDAARDARARNSPAAPNLEAQCRASGPRLETRSALVRPILTTQTATAAMPIPAPASSPMATGTRGTTLNWGKAAPSSFTPQ